MVLDLVEEIPDFEHGDLGAHHQILVPRTSFPHDHIGSAGVPSSFFLSGMMAAGGGSQGMMGSAAGGAMGGAGGGLMAYKSCLYMKGCSKKCADLASCAECLNKAGNRAVLGGGAIGGGLGGMAGSMVTGASQDKLGGTGSKVAGAATTGLATGAAVLLGFSKLKKSYGCPQLCDNGPPDCNQCYERCVQVGAAGGAVGAGAGSQAGRHYATKNQPQGGGGAYGGGYGAYGVLDEWNTANFFVYLRNYAPAGVYDEKMAQNRDFFCDTSNSDTRRHFKGRNQECFHEYFDADTSLEIKAESNSDH